VTTPLKRHFVVNIGDVHGKIATTVDEFFGATSGSTIRMLAVTL
jgi:hypothetical protein